LSRRAVAATILAAALGTSLGAHGQDAGPAAPTAVVAPPVTSAPPPVAPRPRSLRDPEAQSDFQRLWTEESPLTLHLPWQANVTFYGAERLNLYGDSTQSFGATSHDTPIAGPGTVMGSTERWHGSVADSRWGAKLETAANAPFSGIFLVELGVRPSDVPGNAVQTRHLFFGVRTPIVDLLVGRTHDLFGWGGRVPFPSTIASLGVPGELYRQRSQLRLTHVFRFEPVDFEIAAAAVTPFQTDGYSYERQFGFRLAVNRWTGAADQAGGPPAAMSAQIGFSGVRRRFLVPEFTDMPVASYSVVRDALALNVFLPLYPAHGEDLANATSFTLEASSGSGFADLYSGFTGGALYPALPNPQMTIGPVYRPSTPQGVATFDAVGNVRTLNWRALVLNLRYHLPLARGRRVWLAATWSRMSSSNLQTFATPVGVFSTYPETRYVDATAFVSIWRGLQAALSFQRTKQAYATGDHENLRVQLLVAYYF
jgi:hypothetical protein